MYRHRNDETKDLLIREAQPEDAEGILRVFNPIIESGLYTAFDRPLELEEEREYIRGLSPRSIFHVAIRRADQQIVGFQSMEPFATYTRAFDHVGVIGTYVDLACHRLGIATSLFEATFESARRKGYEKLFTYVRADNPAALATYRKHGFQIVGEAGKQARI